MGKSDLNLLENRNKPQNDSQRYLESNRNKGDGSIKSDTENKSSVVTLRKRVNSNMRDFSDESDYDQDGHRIKNKNSIARDKVGFHILEWDHNQEDKYLDGINSAIQAVDINADDQID